MIADAKVFIAQFPARFCQLGNGIGAAQILLPLLSALSGLAVAGLYSHVRDHYMSPRSSNPSTPTKPSEYAHTGALEDQLASLLLSLTASEDVEQELEHCLAVLEQLRTPPDQQSEHPIDPDPEVNDADRPAAP